MRIGIIGAGQIATLFAEGYEKIDGVDVFAVCDRREDLAIERALEWNASRCYTDYTDLLADPDVEAVTILTPHHLHADIAIAAAKAGKHINLAKPIALSLRQADIVLNAADRAGIALQVSDPGLLYPPLLEAKSFIEGGEIGTPIAIRMKATIGSPDGGWAVKPHSWLWRLDPSRCGGGPMLFDLGYHKFAAAIDLMGSIEHVHANVARTEIHPGYFLDAPSVLTWKHFGPNRYGSLELTYAPQLYIRSETYPHIEFIEVTGSRGIIWVHQGPARVMDSAALQLFRDGRVFSFNEIEDDWRAGFYACCEQFVEAVRNNVRPDQDGFKAKRVLRMLLASREAGTHSSHVAVGSD